MRTFSLLVVLATASAFAGDPAIVFEKYRLPNGLTVILSEDHRLPQVAVNIWYHVGAANQTPGHSGFAHLFEHMMFAGTKHVPGSTFEFLANIGVGGGENANGTTNFDRTNYFEVVPSNELETAIWLESDRMGFLLDGLDQKRLEVQRNVVSNERRQRYENSAYAMGRLRVCDELYPSPHPYFQCVIGSIDEVQKASLDEVKRFFKKYYGPNNASLVLVGDFDSAAAKVMIERYFSPIPSGPVLERTEPIATVPLRAVTKATLVDPVAKVPRLSLIWSGVTLYSKDEPAGDVLASILGDGNASRGYQALVVDSKVASSVHSYNSAYGLGGSFEFSAIAAVGVSAQQQLAPMQKVIDEIKANGPSAAEVERAKRKIVAAQVRELERVSGKADMLNAYQTYLGDPGWAANDLARYRAVTPAEVQAFAVKYLRDDRRFEMTQEPAGEGTP